MTDKAFRILEMPSGEFALEKLAGDLWVRIGLPFRSMGDAEMGMMRSISGRQWYYDATGVPLK
jgi:hypothetical protein